MSTPTLRESKISAVAAALDEADLLGEVNPQSGAGKSHARDVIEGLRQRGYAIIRQQPYGAAPGEHAPDDGPDDEEEPETEPEAGSEPETEPEAGSDVRPV